MRDEINDVQETARDGAGGDRRQLLRRAAAVGGAAIVGGAVLARPASAANGDAVEVGGTFTGTEPTELYYDGAGPLPAGPSVISGGEAGSPLQPLFPAGVGGYAVANVANGVHGSTAVADGYGVVAANGAAPTEGAPAPKALVVASLGSQMQFLTPAAVASAAGVADYPATVGPSTGNHVPGELYVDDDYNLWFAVPVAGSAAGVRWVRLAGQSTAGSFVALPAPVRIVDTRQGGGPKVPSGASVVVDLRAAINGSPSGLPAGATAAMVNLTVAETEGSGYHTASSADVTPDATTGHSSVNWDASGQTRANLAVSALGATASTAGSIKMTAGGGGSTHLIIDLLGYYL
jgi:hypothetical protein